PPRARPSGQYVFCGRVSLRTARSAAPRSGGPILRRFVVPATARFGTDERPERRGSSPIAQFARRTRVFGRAYLSVRAGASRILDSAGRPALLASRLRARLPLSVFRDVSLGRAGAGSN